MIRRDRPAANAATRGLGLLALVVLVGCGGGDSATTELAAVTCQGVAAAPADDGQANAFELPSIQDECVALDEYAGDVVLIDFWATWCPPCRDEIPVLVDLQREYGAHGFHVIGISDENPELVRAFVEENGVEYVNLIDPGGQVAGAYGVPGLPTAYLIDRQGNLVKMFFGAKPTGQLESEIRSLLGMAPDA